MEIRNLEYFQPHILFDLMRQVKLLGSEFQPYLDAKISLERIRPEYLSPAQNYLWQKEYRKVQELQHLLVTQYQTSLFYLNGFVRFEARANADHTWKEINLYPIVVEDSIEQDGSFHLIINDGMHRAALARNLRIIPQVLLVRGAACNYYAAPRPDGWLGVEMRANNPGKNYLKKTHRVHDYKRLFRDFEGVFQGAGRSRGIK